jgi:hypothetical protein
MKLEIADFRLQIRDLNLQYNLQSEIEIFNLQSAI